MSSVCWTCLRDCGDTKTSETLASKFCNLQRNEKRILKDTVSVITQINTKTTEDIELYSSQACEMVRTEMWKLLYICKTYVKVLDCENNSKSHLTVTKITDI